MHFLYPGFLWALAAISIPILIHLFYFRRFRTVYFPDISFLKEIKEETSNRNKIRNLLILIMRILAVSALVLAFAQPFIPQGEESGKGLNAVSIYIDNSFSMNASGQDISLIEKAKLDAIKIVRAYDKNDRFQVITNDNDYVQRQWSTQEEAIEKIEQIESSPSVKKISKVMSMQKEAFYLVGNYNHQTYLLSDFQQSTTDFEPEDFDSLTRYRAIVLEGVSKSNISIDSAWWIAPLPVAGQQGQLMVKVSNYSDKDVEELAVNFNYDNQNFPLANMRIPAGKSVTDTLSFRLNKPGWNTGRLEIRDYPVVFDDVYHIAFDVAESLPVLVVQGDDQKSFTETVFKLSKVFIPTITRQTAIDHAGLGKYKLVVLEHISSVSSGLVSSLKAYMENGGIVMLFPGVEIEIDDLNQSFASFGINTIQGVEQKEIQATFINREEFVFKDVFEKQGNKSITLPKVRQRLLLSSSQNKPSRKIIGFPDGRPLIESYAMGKGALYISTSPLDPDLNDLTTRNASVFVPMLYKMALSADPVDPLSFTIGAGGIISVDQQVDQEKVAFKIKGEKEFIPTARNVGSKTLLNLDIPLTGAGIYELTRDEKMVKKVAFNFDRAESNLLTEDESGLKSSSGNRLDIIKSGYKTNNLTEKIRSEEKGVVLWKWFAILALGLLFLEILLLRFFKT